MEAGIDTYIYIYIVAYVCSAYYVDLPTYKQIDDGLCLHKFSGWMYFQESSLSILLCLSYAIVPAHSIHSCFFSYSYSFSYSCSFCCRGGGAHRHCRHCPAGGSGHNQLELVHCCM